MEENTNNIKKKTVCKQHSKKGTVRSLAQALSQLATSINKLADKIIDYQYSDSETRK